MIGSDREQVALSDPTRQHKENFHKYSALLPKIQYFRTLLLKSVTFLLDLF